jgi:DNA-binding GntR family transcriptional regulator
MNNAIVKKSATLREQVFDLVLNELKNGQIAPGTRITEQGLAKQLVVSRTPIREALGQLARQGVLEVRPGGGYLVPSPTDEELHHIIAVRILLEPTAVRMAAEEYDEVHIERISKAIKAEAAAANKSDPSAFARANEEFRHAVFDGLANKALSNLIRQFDNHLQFIRAVTLKDTALRKEVVSRQGKIRDALQMHDGERAQSLWRAYLKYTEDALTEALSQLHGAADVAPARRLIGARAQR